MWSVYQHTFPNGRIYIGISNNPEARWDGGMGYSDANARMFRDIVKYGWDNIKHEILLTGLTEQDARREEQRLIEKNSEDPKHTYNIVYGNKAEMFAKELEDAIWDEVITSDSTSQCMRKIGDDWLDMYPGMEMYVSMTYSANYVEVFRGKEIDGLPCFCWFRANYPGPGQMTYRELADWLWSGNAKFEVVKKVALQ